MNEFIYNSTWAGNNFVFMATTEVYEDPMWPTSPTLHKAYNVLTGQIKDFIVPTDGLGILSVGFTKGDEDWLVYTLPTTPSGVYLYNINTGERRTVYEDPTGQDTAVTRPFSIDIDLPWVVYSNRGDFYAYHIESKETLKLTDYPKEHISLFPDFGGLMTGSTLEGVS